MTSHNFLTTTEAAARLDLAANTIVSLHKRGELTGMRAGGRLLVTADSVAAYEAAYKAKAPRYEDDLVLVEEAAKALGRKSATKLFAAITDGRLGATKRRGLGSRMMRVVSLREVRELFPAKAPKPPVQVPVIAQQPKQPILNASPKVAVRLVDEHFAILHAQQERLEAKLDRVQATLDVLLTPTEAAKANGQGHPLQ